VTVPTEVPAKLIAGDTWQWTRELADYPAPTWTATAYFEKAGSTFSVLATASGTIHAFEVSSATTAPYQSGRYAWRIRVTDGATTATIEPGGYLEVEANPATGSGRDTRSWARRTVEAIECFLEGNASTAQASMSIGGRSISRWSLAELRDFRKDLLAEIAAESQTASNGRGRNIKARYVRS
jgi:hypothetical protein